MGANKNPTFFRYEPIHFILSASKSNAIFETKYLVFCCQNLENQLLHGAHPHFCKPLFLKIQFCLNRYSQLLYFSLTFIDYFQNRKTFKVLLQSFVRQTQVEKTEKWKIWQKSLPWGKLQMWKLCFHVQKTWRNWTVFFDKKERWVWYFVLLIEKNFWNSRLKAKNLQKIWDH